MFKLVRTCIACPEQYDVFYDGENVGYLRLRHGVFRAEYKDEVVYRAAPIGDGIFRDNERDEYLTKACEAIRDAMLPVNYSVVSVGDSEIQEWYSGE